LFTHPFNDNVANTLSCQRQRDCTSTWKARPRCSGCVRV
jgi:hypothetical protein